MEESRGNLKYSFFTQIFTSSEFNKWIVDFALFDATNLMAHLYFPSELYIFWSLFWSEVTGVSFQRVSSRFHTFRHHDFDGDFRSSGATTHSSVIFSVRYMMCWFHVLLCPWDASCFTDPCWCMSHGILFCYWCTFCHGFVLCLRSLWCHVGGILIVIMCEILSYW